MIRYRITMKATISVRDLRNHFPKVRKLVEMEGEVVLTENGTPRYRISLYVPDEVREAPPVDYWDRLNSYMPEALSAAEASALHDENRGDR